MSTTRKLADLTDMEQIQAAFGGTTYEELGVDIDAEVAGQIANEAEAGIVGRWFHTFSTHEDTGKKIDNQGLVLAKVEPGIYLVELYSWLTGSPNGQFLKRLDYFLDGEARFYRSYEAWREAGDA